MLFSVYENATQETKFETIPSPKPNTKHISVSLSTWSYFVVAHSKKFPAGDGEAWRHARAMTRYQRRCNIIG